MQFLKAQRESLWIGDQAEVHGSLGVLKEYVWYQEGLLFYVFLMELSLHTGNVT